MPTESAGVACGHRATKPDATRLWTAQHQEDGMNKWIVSFKVFGYAVVGLMAAAVLYAAYISITFWSGISV